MDRLGSLVFQVTALVLTILAIGLMSFAAISDRTVGRTLKEDFVANAELQAAMLAARIASAVRTGDSAEALSATRAMLRIEGTQMSGVRGYDSAGDLIVSVTSDLSGAVFTGLPDNSPGSTTQKPTTLDSRLLVRMPVVESSRTIGRIDVVFDTTTLATTLAAQRRELALITGSVLAFLGIAIFGLLHHRIGRPLDRVIAAMQGIARDHTDVVVPDARSSEMRRMYEALTVFQDNIVSRRDFAARSAAAEARAKALQAERELAQQAERTAHEARIRVQPRRSPPRN